MKTEINVARIALIGTIITVIGGIIVALITVFAPSKPAVKPEKPTPVAAPQTQVGINQGRVNNINAKEVYYSEKDMIFNNGKQSK